MSAINALAVVNDLLNLSLSAIENAVRVSHLVQRAQTENRELTEAEWESITALDTQVRSRLQSAILNARGSEDNGGI